MNFFLRKITHTLLGLIGMISSYTNTSLLFTRLVCSHIDIVRVRIPRPLSKCSAIKMYHSSAQHDTTVGNVIVDLRSDTITKPNEAMRHAMKDAEVGDDVYGEDPTVLELQRYFAQLLGKEDALFVPSGTMGNLISMLVHCNERGCEVLVGDESHILQYEQAGAAQFGGINIRPVKNLPDGTLCLKDLKNKIRPLGDPHSPLTRLICLENTHNRCGGRVLSLEYLQQVTALAAEHSLPLHLDGARIFNAAVALGCSPQELAKPFVSVSVCFSKGLGAPIGSAIAGPKGFIQRAIRCRKALGGGMRQVGIIAAPCLWALKNNVERMKDDHSRAKVLSQIIRDENLSFLTVEIEAVESNILMIRLEPSVINPQQLCERLAKVDPAEENALSERIVIRCNGMGACNVRLVLHCDVTEKHMVAAEKKLRYVLEELKHARSEV